MTSHTITIPIHVVAALFLLENIYHIIEENHEDD